MKRNDKRREETFLKEEQGHALIGPRACKLEHHSRLSNVEGKWSRDTVVGAELQWPSMRA